MDGVDPIFRSAKKFFCIVFIHPLPIGCIIPRSFPRGNTDHNDDCVAGSRRLWQQSNVGDRPGRLRPKVPLGVTTLCDIICNSIPLPRLGYSGLVIAPCPEEWKDWQAI